MRLDGVGIMSLFFSIEKLLCDGLEAVTHICTHVTKKVALCPVDTAEGSETLATKNTVTKQIQSNRISVLFLGNKIDKHGNHISA